MADNLIQMLEGFPPPPGAKPLNNGVADFSVSRTWTPKRLALAALLSVGAYYGVKKFRQRRPPASR